MAGKGNSIKTTRYGDFRGVDFSTDASLVDTYRSPWSINMLADTGGMPEKRPGWRTLQRLEGPVHGIWFLQKDGTHFVAHAGEKLYTWKAGEEARMVLDGLHNEGNSAGAVMGGMLYIVTGGDFVSFDGSEAKHVEGYVPTTIIARDPKGGGVTYQAVNLLTGRQKNEFIPDGSSRIYQLSGDNLTDDPVEVTVRGESLVYDKDFTVNRAKGTVTFLGDAPAAPTAGQEGEVVITFTVEVEGYRERILGCNILTTYGVGANDRMVFSGNPEHKNVDWTSGLNDPTYIPDLSYSVVGGEETAIMGYRRIGEYLAIIKEDNGQDSTVFMRSAGTTESGTAVFPLKQSIAGVGAVAKGGFGNILDDQMFLSRDGVFALASNVITAERIVQNRSFYVDRLLTKEEGLEKAVAESWNGMYIVAINDHAYLLDGRQNKSYKPKSQGDFVYECYYWTNFPAVCLRNVKEGATETLLFGTADGRVCRMNTDIDTMKKYSDDGEPITAIWSTKSDDDGNVALLKTMIKKGNSVTIKPYARSSAKVCFRTDKDTVDWQAAYDTMDIFSWEDIDFSRFTFNANDAPQEIMFNTKVKKYKRLQIIIKNDSLNEGFGIFSVIKHFVLGNFAKR